MTISPIPFLATGRAYDTHVVTANEHSKAVLRVAAEDFCAANEDAHYFPSYEMISRCIQYPWLSDQRHVSDTAIKQVMELFEKMYLDDNKNKIDWAEAGISKTATPFDSL